MSGLVTGWVLKHGPHPSHVDRNGKPYGQRARGYRPVHDPFPHCPDSRGNLLRHPVGSLAPGHFL
jgi:hypothetical protein